MSFNYKLLENGIMIINDPVHGQIEIKPPFSQIILTKEMQRLKDIGQNGFSIYDYPGLKNNERLSHSVGAFHIMSKMIEHLENELSRYGISISQDDKDMALCSMLLHDIGHGPFSHDCELITKYSHEKRTTDILLGDTEVNELLTAVFGKRKTKKMASYIAEINDENNEIQEQSNSFTKLLKSLISHQLDSDRLDYLVRDSYHAGIKSAIDYKRIIDALGISVNSNQDYEVVIDKTALTDLETVLIERFQRYRDVYFTISTSILQVMFPKILQRYAENPNCVSAQLPEQFKILANNPQDMSLAQFLTLTDKPFLETIETIKKNTSDPILKHLCDLENIKEHYQLLGENVNSKDIIEKLNEIFPQTDLSQTLCVFDSKSKIKIYKKEESLKIDYGNEIKDLSETTNLIRPQDNFERVRTFFNPEILRLELGMSEQEFNQYDKQIKKMIEDINKKPEEFELKYILSDKIAQRFSKEDMLEVLLLNGFKILSEEQKVNDDEYYDTKDCKLLAGKGSLRVRRLTQGDKKTFKATLKRPISQGEVYSSRVEIEESIKEDSIEELKRKLSPKVNDFNFNEILHQPILNSVTERKDYVLERNGIQVCFSFDNITYKNYILSSTIAEDSMIEIEAIGNVKDRVILNEIHEILSNRFKGLLTNKESKYKRGVQKTRENYKRKTYLDAPADNGARR